MEEDVGAVEGPGLEAEELVVEPVAEHAQGAVGAVGAVRIQARAPVIVLEQVSDGCRWKQVWVPQNGSTVTEEKVRWIR